MWDLDGVKVLVDPILVGNLDFGIPWLFDAAKKFLKSFQVFFFFNNCHPRHMQNSFENQLACSDWDKTLVQLSDLPQVDCLLITQSLDDHCHLKTLKPLSKMSPNLKVIATPNAKTLLDPLFQNVSDLLFTFGIFH